MRVVPLKGGHASSSDNPFKSNRRFDLRQKLIVRSPDSTRLFGRSIDMSGASEESDRERARIVTVRQHAGRLAAFIRRRVYGTLLANEWEDVFQEVVMRALQRMPPDAHYGWLEKVALNLIIDRNRKIRERLQPNEAFVAIPDESSAQDRDFWECWYHCLERLNETATLKRLEIPPSALVELKYLEERKLREIADLLGVSTDQAFRWTRRCAELVAVCLKENYLSNEEPKSN